MKNNQAIVPAETTKPLDIRSRIFTIRGVQVMLDRDLAGLYGVLTKNLNKAVKRNIERFPKDFMFQLTKEESLRFQIGTLNAAGNVEITSEKGDDDVLRFQIGTTKDGRGGSRYAPFAFTENGIAMLSSVLRSQRAIDVNIRIMREFVAMRKALLSMSPILSCIETVEHRQLKMEESQEQNEQRFREIFDAMRDNSFPPQKLFLDGQMLDAQFELTRIVKTAKKRIVLIDNYIDERTLMLLGNRRAKVECTVYTLKPDSPKLKPALENYAREYPTLPITIKGYKKSHDRFLIIDNTVWHIGASLKDAGSALFALMKMELDASVILGLMGGAE